MSWRKRSPRRRPVSSVVERSSSTPAENVFRQKISGKYTLVCFSVSLLLLVTFSTATAHAILEEVVYNVHLWVTPRTVSSSAAAVAAENARLLGRILLRRQLQDAPEVLHQHHPQQTPKTHDSLQYGGITLQQKAAGTIIPPPQSAASVSKSLQQQQREGTEHSTATATWLSYADDARLAVLEEYRTWMAAQERETFNGRCIKRGSSRSSITNKYISPAELSAEPSIAAREIPTCEDYSIFKEMSISSPAPFSKLFPLLSLRLSRAATTDATAAAAAVAATGQTELMTSIPLSMLLSQSEALLLQTGQQQQHGLGESTSPSSSLLANLLRWTASFFVRPLQLPQACAQAPFLLSLHLSPVSLLPFSVSVQRVVDVLGIPSASEAFQFEAAADADLQFESSSSNQPSAATAGAKPTAAEPTARPVMAASRNLFLTCQRSVSASFVQQQQHYPLAEESSRFSKAPAPALQLVLPPLLAADTGAAGAWMAPGFFPRELDFAAAAGMLSQQLQQKQEAAASDSSDQQQQQPFWRRYWWLLLVAFMVLTAAGGGGPQAADERSGTAATEQRQQQAQQRLQQPSNYERNAASGRATNVRQRSRTEKKR